MEVAVRIKTNPRSIINKSVKLVCKNLIFWKKSSGNSISARVQTGLGARILRRRHAAPKGGVLRDVYRIRLPIGKRLLFRFLPIFYDFFARFETVENFVFAIFQVTEFNEPLFRLAVIEHVDVTIGGGSVSCYGGIGN